MNKLYASIPFGLFAVTAVQFTLKEVSLTTLVTVALLAYIAAGLNKTKEEA